MSAQIRLHERGGMSVFGGNYDARKDTPVLEIAKNEIRTITLRYPEDVTGYAIDPRGVTISSHARSGETITLTLTNAGDDAHADVLARLESGAARRAFIIINPDQGPRRPLEDLSVADVSDAIVIPRGADAGRQLQDWMGDVLNVKADWGAGAATGDGTTDDLAAFNGMFAEGAGSYFIGPGAYALSANSPVPDEDISVEIDPAATFPSTGAVNFYPALLYQGSVVKGLRLLAKTVGDAEGNYNYFMNANFITNQGEPNAVAVFGSGISESTTGSAWGGNFIGYSNLSGATAIACELNFGALASGGIAFGLVIACAGNFQPSATSAAIQIQSNNASSRPFYGLRFNGDCIDSTGRVISASGMTCQYGIRMEQSVSFTVAELAFPSLLVDPTPSSFNSRLRVTGGSGSTGPIMRAAATGDTPATNADLSFCSLGTGNVRFFTNGTAVEAFRINHVASAVNMVRVQPSTTGNAVTVLAAGSDIDIDIAITPKGAGVLKFGTHTGIGAETVTGYISVKDSGGTARKVAVVS